MEFLKSGLLRELDLPSRHCNVILTVTLLSMCGADKAVYHCDTIYDKKSLTWTEKKLRCGQLD